MWIYICGTHDDDLNYNPSFSDVWCMLKNLYGFVNIKKFRLTKRLCSITCDVDVHLLAIESAQQNLQGHRTKMLSDPSVCVECHAPASWKIPKTAVYQHVRFVHWRVLPHKSCSLCTASLCKFLFKLSTVISLYTGKFLSSFKGAIGLNSPWMTYLLVEIFLLGHHSINYAPNSTSFAFFGMWEVGRMGKYLMIMKCVRESFFLPVSQVSFCYSRSLNCLWHPFPASREGVIDSA